MLLSGLSGRTEHPDYAESRQPINCRKSLVLRVLEQAEPGSTPHSPDSAERLTLSPLPVSSARFIPSCARSTGDEPQDLPLPPTSLCCAVGASSAAVGSARPVNPVPSEAGTYRGDSHEAALCKPDFPKTGGRRSSPARARTMAGRDAAAFIRRRRLIMSLPSPRTGTERTCHPAPPDSRTRRRSTFPTFPASGPRRTAAPPPNHCPRRTRHLSAPWLHARHLTVPAHLPSSAPSSRQPFTFAQTPRTIRAFLTSHRHSVGSRPSLLFDPSRSRAPTRSERLRP